MNRKLILAALTCLFALLLCLTASADSITPEGAPDIETGVLYHGNFHEQDAQDSPESEYGFVYVNYYFRYQAPDEPGWIIFGGQVSYGGDMGVAMLDSDMHRVCGIRSESFTYDSFRTAPGETYYVVAGLNSATPGVTDFEARTYSFSLIFQPDPESETRGSAAPMEMDRMSRGTLAVGSDQDWFTFTTGDESQYVWSIVNENLECDTSDSTFPEALDFYLYREGEENYTVFSQFLSHAGQDKVILTDRFEPNTTYYVNVFGKWLQYSHFTGDTLPAYQLGISNAAKIVFDPGAGSGEMSPWYKVPGETVHLPDCPFTPPEGMVFDTWSLGDPGTEITLDQSLVCTAIWKRDPNLWPDESAYSFTVDGLNYRIINATDAEFTGLAEKNSMTTVSIPDIVPYPDTIFVFNITQLAANALAKDTRVKSVTLPETVSAIGAKAFVNCKALTKVNIPAGVSRIEKNTFQNCAKLKTISGMTGVTEIGASAFQGCKALTKFTIPAKVKAIGAKAFYKCAKLKSIVIRTTKLTVKTVGANAFKGVYKKATVKVPAKKLKAYKTLLVKKGLPKTAKIKK